MRAHAVIGANYGDEGKGLMVDYLCSVEKPDAVIRFNGGAQAGHTVVASDGARHVFHHFGAGSMLGIPTYLSEYFIVNPLLFAKEEFDTKVYCHPRALVTIPADMIVNQCTERALGRHASCGIGIHETMKRSAMPRYRVEVMDMLACSERIREYDELFNIEKRWQCVFEDFAKRFLERVELAVVPPGETFIFEGAQGLMLDQNSPDFPYVTHSHTGMRNVRAICDRLRIADVRATYVTRSYLTRHGDGPLPGERALPAFVCDETNVDHPFQGALRYAPLDVLALERRVIADAGGIDFDMAVTCLDQLDDGILDKFSAPVAYTSHGPTRESVQYAHKELA